MARYLVTGGCGFIGSHLCDALLARGDQVTVLDNLSTGRRENLSDACKLIVGNANDPDAVMEGLDGVAGVFHLAAIASVQRCNEEWRSSHVDNQTSSITVFDAARKSGRIPVVYASSAAVYGNAGQSAIAETAPKVPLTAYGADKLGSELHASVAQLVHGVRTVGLRPFNVYGPRQDPRSPYSGVISIFSDRQIRGEAVTIFGDGKQYRDFVYVVDVVSFFLSAMAHRSETAAIFNIASGKSTTLLQLVSTLSDLLGRKPELDFRPARTGDIRYSVGDPSLAARELGVTTRIPLERGLSSMMEQIVCG